MIFISSFHRRLLALLALLCFGIGLYLTPPAFAAVGDTCQNAQGVSVDQLCDVGAGELCRQGVCVYVPLEAGGTGLSIPTGQVQVSDSIVQDRNLGELLILVVNYFIGFLGIVATVMFIYAGVLWVVSGGEQDSIDKAKKIMTYAVLGIVVILFSYSIVRFVTGAADKAGAPGGLQGQGGVGQYQCDVSSDCAEGHYCFQNECKPSVKTSCQDNSQCGAGGQCSPLGVCFNSNAGSGVTCQNDTNCNLGFVCNLGTNKCDLGGIGQGGGILGGGTQGQTEDALKAVDLLMQGMGSDLDLVNSGINDFDDQLKGEVLGILESGSFNSKKTQLQALLNANDDPQVIQTLERILIYLERLEDLRDELNHFQQVMPESQKTLSDYEKTSASLNEAMSDSRSSIKFSRFEKNYTDLKILIRQFPIVQSRIRAIPGEGSAPLTVTFNGLDSIDPTGGTISDYKWSFLDNKGNLVSLGNDPVVVHTFTEPNTYSIRLQVSTAQTDEAGYKMAMDGISTVRVKVNPPTSNVEFRLNGKKITDVYHVTLKEAQTGLSFDPSPTTPAFGRVIDQYEWLFGDGIREVRSNPSTVIHSYEAGGEYLVTLKIRDNAGVEDRKVVKLILKPLAADAQISPLQGDVTQEFTFKGAGSRSDNGSITQYQWEVMDAQGNITASFQDPEVRHYFDRPGDYEIALTVTDSSGQSDRSLRSLSVLSRDPVAGFNYHIPEKNRPNAFHFNAASSYDPDEGDTLTYSWDFDGDGGFEVVGSQETSVTHTYRQAGEYRAVLQVQDSFGQRNQVEKRLVVDSTLGGEILLNKKSFRVGEEVAFKAASPGAVAYLWEFGDGQTQSSEEDSITHIYNKKGKYKVTLHFFDRNDNSNTHTFTVLVGDKDSPLAMAQAKVNEYTPTLIPDACGVDKPAMTVNRNDRIMFSAVDSINTDGSSRLLDYTWELSESVQNTSRDFSYRFTQLTPGDQCASATLRVRDQISGKVSDQDTLYFKVVNTPPILSDFVVQPLSEERVTPTKIRLKAINPSDVDGEIKRYRWWYFREGNEQEKLGIHSTTTPETEMILVAKGQPGMENRYIFVVEITDNDGGSYTSLEDYGSVTYLDIINGPNLSPVVDFTVDKTTIAVGDSISFVSKAYDPQGETFPNSAFRWDFDGNGIYEDTTSGPQVNRQYNTPGQFNVRLNVSHRGLSSSVVHTVNVEPTNHFPQAAFTYTVDGTTVNFNALYSRSHPGVETIPLRYEWDFNIQEDSSGSGVSDDDLQSTEATPSFTYPRLGSYPVRLKVIDNTGGIGIVRRQVNLNVSAQSLEQDSYRSLRVRAVDRPMTQLSLQAFPLVLQIGQSAEITAKVENADHTPYQGNVFFEIIEGSGEFTPNPALGSVASDSEATAIFTATSPGPVRVRVKATGTFHGDLSEDLVVNVNPS